MKYRSPHIFHVYNHWSITPVQTGNTKANSAKITNYYSSHYETHGGGLYTRRHLNKELRLVVVIEYLNSGYNKKLTKIYHFICSNKNDSLVNHICKYNQFTQKYTKLLSQHTNHTIIIHFCPD